MDDHLVALAGGTGIYAVVQGGLGEYRQRIGLLLLHRRWIAIQGLVVLPLVQGLPRCRESFQEQGADLG